MANRIAYLPQGIILSSQLGEIVVDTTHEYVDVRLSGHASVVLLEERYYAYGGYVRLLDFARLIEEHMALSATAYEVFTIRVSTDGADVATASVRILYCDRYTVCSDSARFLAENFLTTLSMRRVAPDTTLSLFFFAEQGESIAYTVAHRFRKTASDAIYSHSFVADSGKTAAASGVVQLNIPMSAIVADAASLASVRQSEIAVLSFTVSVGQRSETCHVDPSLVDRDSFAFRNCFNVWDVALLPCVTTAKTDVDRSLAVVNGTSSFYNQSVNKTYEVIAGPLTSDEADWIDQLFAAHTVMRFESGTLDENSPLVFAEVLISDCTCEISDSDEKPNTAKFTWRYADNRPIIRLSASPAIFTSPYNPVYS